MKTYLPLLLALSLSGCHIASTAEEYRWSVKAPAQVQDVPHSKLRFVVDTTTSSGSAVEGVAYIWIVDWVGLHGVEHQGYSSREEAIRIKGGPGIAVLRILAVDRYERLVEVAKTSFEVTSVQASP